MDKYEIVNVLICFFAASVLVLLIIGIILRT
jgi:hypothetical protein